VNEEDIRAGLKTATDVLDAKTQQVSAIVRQLAFTGLAFVWLLVAGVGQPTKFRVSEWSVLSLIAFSLAVALDAAQYVATVVSWRRLRSTLRSELARLDTASMPIDAGMADPTGPASSKSELNRRANRWAWVFFFTKTPIAGLGWIFAAIAIWELAR
jgi:hypothetical protein